MSDSILNSKPVNLNFQFPLAEDLNNYIINFKNFSDNHENVASFNETKYKIYHEYNYEYFRNKVYGFIVDEALKQNYAVCITFKEGSKNNQFDISHYEKLREELESSGYKVEYQENYQSMTVCWNSEVQEQDEYEREYVRGRANKYGYVNLPQEIENAIIARDEMRSIGLNNTKQKAVEPRKSERLRKRKKMN